MEDGTAYRLAVATVLGSWETQHYGQADTFLVFDLVDGTWAPVEARATDPACGTERHRGARHAVTVDLLRDCDGVLSARIGPGAAERLRDAGIETYEMQGAVEDALVAVAADLGHGGWRVVH